MPPDPKSEEEYALKEIDLINDEDDEEPCIIVGRDGILNEEECLHLFQICSMTEDELEEFVANDYELLDDEEWDDFSLKHEHLKKLPMALIWRWFRQT